MEVEERKFIKFGTVCDKFCLCYVLKYQIFVEFSSDWLEACWTENNLLFCLIYSFSHKRCVLLSFFSSSSIKSDQKLIYKENNK